MHDIEHAVAHDYFALARRLADDLRNLFRRLDLMLVMAAE
jgi:hypothetical protein